MQLIHPIIPGCPVVRLAVVVQVSKIKITVKLECEIKTESPLTTGKPGIEAKLLIAFCCAVYIFIAGQSERDTHVEEQLFIFTYSLDFITVLCEQLSAYKTHKEKCDEYPFQHEYLPAFTSTQV